MQLIAQRSFACLLEEIFGNIILVKNYSSEQFVLFRMQSSPILLSWFLLILLVGHSQICYENDRNKVALKGESGIWVREARHRFKYHLLHNE